MLPKDTTSALIERPCESCSAPFLIWRSKIAVGQGRYCSQTCWHRARRARADALFLTNVTLDGDCWLRMVSRGPNGYAYVTVNGYTIPAHRHAWALADGGTTDDALNVCHTCDIPNCIRNDERGVYIVNGVTYPRWGHLFLAPKAANSQDMVNKQRHGAQRDPSIRQGTRNGRAIATEAEVLAIRVRKITERVTYAELAHEFGLSCIQVKSICLRRAWKHLP